MKNSAILVSLLILCLTIYLTNIKENLVPVFSLRSTLFEGSNYPSDILFHDDKIWLTELRGNRVSAYPLSAFSDPDLATPITSSSKINSPHFLTSNGNLMFVSAGWGEDIYKKSAAVDSEFEVTDFSPLTLKAPHGLCIKDGWLYVADSLNSRLVRKKLESDLLTNIEPQIFSDTQSKISYVRQIRCDEAGVWLVNSYENRPGLNLGKGSNILLVKNFMSGEVDIKYESLTSNATGMELINGRYLIVGLWQANKIVMLDLKNRDNELLELELPKPYAGPPYGMNYSAEDKKLYVAFIGDLYKEGNFGGVATYDISF